MKRSATSGHQTNSSPEIDPPMPSAVQAELMAAVDTSSSVCIYETGVQSGVVEALLQRGSNSFRPF